MNIIPPVYADPPLPPTSTPIPLGKICGEGLGPFADFLCKLSPDPGANKNNAIKTVAAIAFLISNVVGVLSVVAGIIFIINFLIAGIGWLTAGGDKTKLESAQQKLINSIVGLIIVLAAYALISLVGGLLGFDILITHPETFVENLGLR